jgi:hypothetical protein
VPALLALLVAAAPAPWTQVAPGVEYRAFVLEPAPAEGDGLAHVVRVDPAVASLGFGLASEHGGTLRTAKEWCDELGFSVVINAGMYGTDYASNVGFLRHREHHNNRGWNGRYQSVLGFHPKKKGAPGAVILDMDAPGADAKRHNAALVEWAATRNDVSCVVMAMPLDPGSMASDGFHPGEPVYRYCASTIARHIATEVWPHIPTESHA